MMLLCNWYVVADILKGPATFSFKASPSSTDGGSKLLQQGSNNTSLKGIISQKDQIQISTTIRTSNSHMGPTS